MLRGNISMWNICKGSHKCTFILAARHKKKVQLTEIRVSGIGLVAAENMSSWFWLCTHCADDGKRWPADVFYVDGEFPFLQSKFFFHSVALLGKIWWDTWKVSSPCPFRFDCIRDTRRVPGKISALSQLFGNLCCTTDNVYCRLTWTENIYSRCTWWSLSGMQATLAGTGCRELGRGVAFPGNVNIAEPSPGPYTHSQLGLCSGIGSAEC